MAEIKKASEFAYQPETSGLAWAIVKYSEYRQGFYTAAAFHAQADAMLYAKLAADVGQNVTIVSCHE